MSDLLIGASVLAAFFGGILALFAPCCITFLMPSYFASAFKQRLQLLKMTFIFAAGIATIIVPISLGLTALSALFNQYHKEIFTIGGLFLILLGVLSFLGKNLPMPMFSSSLPKERNAASVYGLGLFSGTASSCCAPVLAGVLTLTTLSGSFFQSLFISFAYVLGMVAPLFLLAFFGDKFKITNIGFLRNKKIAFKLATRQFSVTSNNLIASILFFSMGILVLYLGLSGNNTFAPGFQTEMSRTLTDFSNVILEKFKGIPNLFVGAVLVLLFTWLVKKAFFAKAERNIKDE